MKIAISTHDDHKFSIMQQIIDGRLAIDSPEEFKGILEIYPEDPFLYRKYADLLSELKCGAEAARAYETAAGLFIDNGANLQAIVAKILQWQIVNPSHHQGRQFHALLCQEGVRQTPLQNFWTQLTYPELVAVIRRLSRVRFSAGKKIVNADQPAENIYFVVSGTVTEIPSEACENESRMAGIDVEPILLGPNDVFGEVFPLDDATQSETEIRAASDVELVKIGKADLHKISQQHPRIETLLYAIHKPENRELCDRAWKTVRRSMRYGLPAHVQMRCLSANPSDSTSPSWHYDGIAVDVSIGGICVNLGATDTSEPGQCLKGRMVQLNIDLPDKMRLLNISGKIAWQSRQGPPGDSVTLIGVRFDTLGVMDRDMLTKYCSAGFGEHE
jgi:CRP-like cAMP-binding protein